VLGGQPVVDRHHDRADLGGDPPAVRVVELEAADHESTAVDVDQAGQDPVVVGGAIPPHPHVGGVVGSGDHELVDVEGDRWVVRRQRVHQRALAGTRRRDVGEGQLGEDRRPRRELGVVGVARRLEAHRQSFV
jgi:hypothetical protein